MTSRAQWKRPAGRHIRAIEWLAYRIAGPDPRIRSGLRATLIRVLILGTLFFGIYYIIWRYLASVNMDAWFIALPLLAAETYSFVGMLMFATTVWKAALRPSPRPLRWPATADVFITCYNEPVEIVRKTLVAALAIEYPHKTYLLDDGDSPEMREMATSLGGAYIVRGEEWNERSRHAKAGNLNNALFRTHGEFILILDADQIPFPDIFDRVLGYFSDPRVAFVQTPQYFSNVPPGDPFGAQAPLFYGPIQQGKDGWNAAFFCGSNAVVRREALMELGIRRYVFELHGRVRRALNAASAMIRQARKEALAAPEPRRTDILSVVGSLQDIVAEARASLRAGRPIQELTWRFQARCRGLSESLIQADLERLWIELGQVPGLDVKEVQQSLGNLLDDPGALSALTRRDLSPLTAIEAARRLLLAIDVDRQDEAQAVMPMATLSVTEDMATAMRLHAAGWKSIYHDEILATGLAPEDLQSALQQRLRWAQGTLQVMLKENPILQRGLSFGQRTMYLATMWSYLSGFAAIVYIAAPILYLFTGISPVRAFSSEFFWHLLPYLIANQLLFVLVGWGRSTWRGQQYSLALFPLWITAVASTIQNVYFGKKLTFVVTPKTRQRGASFSLVKPQLVAMVLLAGAALYGLVRIALGVADDPGPILVNVAWVAYDLLLLSVVVEAALYAPPDEAIADPAEPAQRTPRETRGRIGAGGA